METEPLPPAPLSVDAEVVSLLEPDLGVRAEPVSGARCSQVSWTGSDTLVGALTPRGVCSPLRMPSLWGGVVLLSTLAPVTLESGGPRPQWVQGLLPSAGQLPWVLGSMSPTPSSPQSHAYCVLQCWLLPCVKQVIHQTTPEPPEISLCPHFFLLLT